MLLKLNLKYISPGVLFFFLTSLLPQPLYAGNLLLPSPGTMVHLSTSFNPSVLKGLKIHPENPFRFDFILDPGRPEPPIKALGGKLREGPLKEQPKAGSSIKDPSASLPQDDYMRLIKYFLASITIPEKDLWVNLSPYEKDRIVPDAFGQTEMGRDLLAQDYLLKQLTASLIYPEGETGKQFWNKVYAEAAKRYGHTTVPVNTFNKVWIMPDKAVVYENAKAGTAYVVESKLKVMLEEDYLAAMKNRRQPGDMFKTEQPRTCPQAGCQATKGSHVKATEGTNGPRSEPTAQDDSEIASQILRDLVIPQLTKEVNEGKNFAQLRQVYNSLILAHWYKKKIKDSILAKIYADKNKIAGLLPTRGHVQDRTTKNVSPSGLPSNNGLNVKATEGTDPLDVDAIYHRYLEAFKKGAYNYIKEEIDPATRLPIPRRYFSGGFGFNHIATTMTTTSNMDLAQLGQSGLLDVGVNLIAAGFKDQAMAGTGNRSAGEDSLDKLSIRYVLQRWNFFQPTVWLEMWKWRRIQDTAILTRIYQASAHVKTKYLSMKASGRNAAADEFLKEMTNDLLTEILKIKGMDERLFDSVRHDPMLLNLRIQNLAYYIGHYQKVPVFRVAEVPLPMNDLTIGWELPLPYKKVVAEIKRLSLVKKADVIMFSAADIVSGPEDDFIYVHSGFIWEEGELVFTFFKQPIRLAIAVNGDQYPIPNVILPASPVNRRWLISPEMLDLIYDKSLQNEFFKKHGIKTPFTIVLAEATMSKEAIAQRIKSDFMDRGVKRIVVKPNRDRAGGGVLFFDLTSAQDAVSAAAYVHHLLASGNERSQRVIIQDYIEGYEIRVYAYRDKNGRLKRDISVAENGLARRRSRAAADIVYKDVDLSSRFRHAEVGEIKAQINQLIKRMYEALELDYGDPLIIGPDLRMNIENGEISVQELNWGLFSFYARPSAAMDFTMLEVSDALVRRANVRFMERVFKRSEDRAVISVSRPVMPAVLQRPPPKQLDVLVPAQVIYDEAASLEKISAHKDRIVALLKQLQGRLGDVGESEQEILQTLFAPGHEDITQPLVELASLLRMPDNFPYEKNLRDPRPPLMYGIEEKAFFRIGRGLYLSPTTESFKRHFIFKTDDQGRVLFAYEIMIPGQLPSRWHPKVERRKNVADYINENFPHSNFSTNVIMARHVPYEGKRLYDEDWPESTIELAVYEYKFDGKRFSHVSPDVISGWADQLGMSAHDLTAKLFKEAVESFWAVKSLGYVGNTSLGNDLHTENLRTNMVYDQHGKLVGVKMQMVGDFQSFLGPRSDASPRARSVYRQHRFYPYTYSYFAFMVVLGVCLGYLRSSWNGVPDPSLMEFLLIATLPFCLTIIGVLGMAVLVRSLKFEPEYILRQHGMMFFSHFEDSQGLVRLVRGLTDGEKIRLYWQAYRSVYAAKKPTSTKDKLTAKIRLLKEDINDVRTGIQLRFVTKKDRAMAAVISDPKKGGIDLTAVDASTVQNSGQALQFHIDPAQLRQLQSERGFTPRIISIQPVSDLRAFLGLNA